MNDERFARLTSRTLLPCLLGLTITGAAQSYTVTDLGPPSKNSSGARAINSAGQAAGYAYTSSTKSNVFLYTGGKMTILRTLGGTTALSAECSQVSDAGQVTGAA